MRTVTTFTIELDGKELKKNLINNFLTTLNNQSEDTDLQDLLLLTADMNKCLNYLNTSHWARLFNEGYTAMLLSPEVFDYVDKYFLDKKKAKHNNSLELKIRGLSGNVDLFVYEDDINY